jgi:hypothetical protein
MGKITIKHYLNKTVKPRFNGKVNTYPIYVQIIADRVNYKMKSNFDYWDGFISDSDFNSDFVQNSLNNEKQEIEKVVYYLIENEKKDLLNADGFKRLSAKFWDTLNYNFWIRFVREANENTKASIPNSFYNATFLDIAEILRFTESQIEQKFSNDYSYLSIGMQAMLQALLPYDKYLKINEITVFDFLFEPNKKKNVLEAVIRYDYYGMVADGKYNIVLNELEKIIFEKEK